MATFYFCDINTSDHDWADPSGLGATPPATSQNWFMDATLQTPATQLPSPTDDVIVVNSELDHNSGDTVNWPPTCSANTMTCTGASVIGAVGFIGFAMNATYMNDASAFAGGPYGGCPEILTGDLWVNSTAYQLVQYMPFATNAVYANCATGAGPACDLSCVQAPMPLQAYICNASIPIVTVNQTTWLSSQMNVGVYAPSLTGGNIAAGVNILGVGGAIQPPEGNAAVGDVRAGKTFMNSTGGPLTGTLVPMGGSPDVMRLTGGVPL